MPLARVNGQILHFAHVPRTGGTSVENYLAARFGALAFLDRDYLSVPVAARWSRTSPQHIETAAFSRIVPGSWISHRFTVVRHPEDRLVSVFRYQRDAAEAFPCSMSFEDWLVENAAVGMRDLHFIDNHALPACDLVPDGAVVFRIEDGFAPLLAWLDDIEGVQRGPRDFPHDNGYAERLTFLGRSPGPRPEVTARARAVIAELYADDFRRFGYMPRNDAQERGPAPAQHLGSPEYSPPTTMAAAPGGAAWQALSEPEQTIMPHLLADRRVVALEPAGTGMWQALVPAGTRELRLKCRAVRPSDLSASPDRRLLGLAVHGLELDGMALDLPGGGQGWHELEQDGGHSWRWTNGDALLPVSIGPEPARLVLRGALPEGLPSAPSA